VDSLTIGRELRARRTAAGRTVASVAADAGLSVPYIANLENGRGNPTTTALSRLAEALGMRLAVTLVPGDAVPAPTPAPAVPPSLVRLGRTARFRQAAAVMSAALERDAGEFSGELVAALALLGQAMSRELAEADWWRLLDALLLIAAHPAASLPLASGPGGGRGQDRRAVRNRRHPRERRHLMRVGGAGNGYPQSRLEVNADARADVLDGLQARDALEMNVDLVPRTTVGHISEHKVARDGKGWVESRFAHGFSLAAGKPGSGKAGGAGPARREFPAGRIPRCPSN
jgi:transcriptional regulator with XRE-family HTH domain